MLFDLKKIAKITYNFIGFKSKVQKYHLTMFRQMQFTDNPKYFQIFCFEKYYQGTYQTINYVHIHINVINLDILLIDNYLFGNHFAYINVGILIFFHSFNSIQLKMSKDELWNINV